VKPSNSRTTQNVGLRPKEEEGGPHPKGACSLILGLLGFFP
jgi:hypothetical protein